MPSNQSLPKSVPVQPQSPRVATNTPPPQAHHGRCGLLQIIMTKTPHVHLRTPVPANRPVVHPRPAAAETSNRGDPPDSNGLNQRRQTSESDGRRVAMTRVRNCQHTTVIEVRTNSWWEMVLQNLFFARGESVFQPSRRHDTEV